MSTELRTNPELEAVIFEDPLEPDGWLVYGDWLQAEGDPRGELVAVQAKLARDPGNPELMDAQRALLQLHGAKLLAGLEAYLTPRGERGPLVRVSWEFGFLWTANVTSDHHGIDEVVAGLRALLRHPSSRFLNALSIGTPPDNDWKRLVTVLLEAERPSLRILFLGSARGTQRMGDLSALWKAVPHVEILGLRGGAVEVGQLDLPLLRELTIETAALQRETLGALGARSWPRLEKLELWFGDRRCTCAMADVEPLLEGSRFPRLQRLALRNCAFVDRLCGALVRASLSRQLTVLDLSLGTLGDDGGEALIAGRSAFRALAVLDLHHHYLGVAMQAELRSLTSFVDVGILPRSRETPDVDDEEDPSEELGRRRVWLDG